MPWLKWDWRHIRCHRPFPNAPRKSSEFNCRVEKRLVQSLDFTSEPGQVESFEHVPLHCRHPWAWPLSILATGSRLGPASTPEPVDRGHPPRLLLCSAHEILAYLFSFSHLGEASRKGVVLRPRVWWRQELRGFCESGESSFFSPGLTFHHEPLNMLSTCSEKICLNHDSSFRSELRCECGDLTFLKTCS